MRLCIVPLLLASLVCPYHIFPPHPRCIPVRIIHESACHHQHRRPSLKCRCWKNRIFL